MSEDDDFTDEIQLYGAIGVGGALLAFNMRSPPLTPSTVIVPVVAAGAWYLFTPLVVCMISGKGVTLCLAKGAAETVGDLAGDIANSAGEITNTVVQTVGGVIGGVAQGVMNTGSSFVGGIALGSPPAAGANVVERWNYELDRLSFECGRSGAGFGGLAYATGIAKPQACKDLEALETIQQTPDELAQYGPWTRSQTWDCRYNSNCVRTKTGETTYTNSGQEIFTFDNGNPDVIVHRDGSGTIVSLQAAVEPTIAEQGDCGGRFTQSQCNARATLQQRFNMVMPEQVVNTAAYSTLKTQNAAADWFAGALDTLQLSSRSDQRLSSVFEQAWEVNQLAPLSDEQLYTFAAQRQYVLDEWKVRADALAPKEIVTNTSINSSTSVYQTDAYMTA